MYTNTNFYINFSWESIFVCFFNTLDIIHTDHKFMHTTVWQTEEKLGDTIAHQTRTYKIYHEHTQTLELYEHTDLLGSCTSMENFLSRKYKFSNCFQANTYKKQSVECIYFGVSSKMKVKYLHLHLR